MLYDISPSVLRQEMSQQGKGSDWIRLVFAHPFPFNNGAPVASTNFISDGKFQRRPQASLALFRSISAEVPTNGWAQSSPYPVSPFSQVG